MRCRDLNRALESDGDGIDPDALAEHLAACPRCAEQAGRADRLERLWEATRPAEPAPEVWDAVWARVTEAADAAPSSIAPRRAAPSSRPRWTAAVVAVGIAQAAALLLGAFYLGRPGPARPQVARAAAATPARADVEIDPNQIVLVTTDLREVSVVRVESEENENSIAVDPGFVALGLLEAMAD